MTEDKLEESKLELEIVNQQELTASLHAKLDKLSGLDAQRQQLQVAVAAVSSCSCESVFAGKYRLPLGTTA